MSIYERTRQEIADWNVVRVHLPTCIKQNTEGLAVSPTF
jgi:hypothetical protein